MKNETPQLNIELIKDVIMDGEAGVYLIGGSGFGTIEIKNQVAKIAKEWKEKWLEQENKWDIERGVKEEDSDEHLDDFYALNQDEIEKEFAQYEYFNKAKNHVKEEQSLNNLINILSSKG